MPNLPTRAPKGGGGHGSGGHSSGSKSGGSKSGGSKSGGYVGGGGGSGQLVWWQILLIVWGSVFALLFVTACIWYTQKGTIHITSRRSRPVPLRSSPLPFCPVLSCPVPSLDTHTHTHAPCIHDPRSSLVTSHYVWVLLPDSLFPPTFLPSPPPNK